MQYGCIETLCALSNVYPATVYPKAWSCFKDLNIPKSNILQRSNSQVANQSVAINCSSDLFSLCISLLNNSNVGYDLNAQHNLLKLCGNVFAGKSYFTKLSKRFLLCNL